MFRLNHKIKLIILAIIITFPTLSVADDESAKPTDAHKQLLFEKLAQAESEQEGRLAESSIWEYWFDQSPSKEVRASLDAGIERREAYDYAAAEAHLDIVVKVAPDYAEGFNQRAFIRFLREDYEAALVDLEVALSFEPDHFGALSGMFHTLQNLNRPEAAMKALQLAVEIHPWIQERSALPQVMWPESFRKIHEPGQEI